MNRFFSTSIFLFFFSYFFLGLSEEVVLAVATLLFIGFFLSRLQKMVSEGFLKTIYEYEENYLLLFFLRQTFLYRIYHILLTSKNFLYYFFLQFIFFLKTFRFFAPFELESSNELSLSLK